MITDGLLRAFDLAALHKIDVRTLKNIQRIVENEVNCNGMVADDITIQIVMYLKYCKEAVTNTMTVQDLKREITIIEKKCI
ncbi:hypothetical protein AAGS61_11990 [Lysinibacillus sp. KU-BSD001]|uniref:hypothetical protein n=1 Tax=Lysinibacillus sp. KU-BSD001 TaxID=3141328 RepID=UPI0036E2C056